MTIRNLKHKFIDFDFVDPLCSGSSYAPYPEGCEEPSPEKSGRARHSQNQLLPLGLGQIIDFQKRITSIVIMSLPFAAENFAILRSIIDTAIKNNPYVLLALNVIAEYKRN